MSEAKLKCWDDLLAKAEATYVKRSVRKAADPLLITSMSTPAIKKEVAERFIDQVVDESKLLQMISVHRTDAPSGEIAKLNINTHVTRGATENTAFTETRRPVDTSISFVTKKTVSGLDVSGEWQEDNIEGKGGKNTVTSAFYKAIANDMDTLAIEGDASQVGTDDFSMLIKVNDGFHVLTSASAGANIVNANALQPSYKLLSAMLRAMPTKWKRDESKLRWMMSWGAAASLRDEFAARGTDFGDQTRITGGIPTIMGIPIEIVTKIPEDLTLTGTAGTTGTFIWLTDPKNFMYVVQRDFKAEWERKPRQDHDELTIHMRTDFLVQEVTAVVKATNVSVYSPAAFYGA